MTLQELVNQACKVSSDFDKRISYRLNKRKKQPDREWLLAHLIDILGSDYVKEAMQDHIAKQDVEN